MAWNESSEKVIEQYVDELGRYLMARGDRTPREIVKTQDICRDFSEFISKDIHSASTQDYTVYKQLHVLTSEDDSEYQRMLSDIREFCGQDGASVPPVRQRAMTSHVEPSDEIMAMLMSPDMEENNPYASGSVPAAGPSERAHSSAARRMPSSGSERLSGIRGAVPMHERLSGGRPSVPTHERLSGGYSAIPTHERLSGSRAAVPTHERSGSETSGIEAPVGFSFDNLSDVPEDRRSISKRFNEFDFSVDEKLAGNEELQGPSSNSVDMSVGGRSASNSLSSFFPSEEDDDDVGSPEMGDDVASRVAENDMSESLVEKKESLANNELLRGVSGVDYNFNKENLTNMRRGEMHKLKAAARENAVNPIDESLIHFRSYYFDGKYLIDIQTPKPESYRHYVQSVVSRWVIPLIPALVTLAISLTALTFSVMIGMICMVVPVIFIVLVLPDILPPAQQTPVAALSSYLAARDGRCYVAGASLLAVVKVEEHDIEMSAVWPDPPAWPSALIHRLRHSPVPQMRIISGSDKQNTVLVLCTSGNDYWVVPLVQVDNAWCLTDPMYPVHHLEGENADP